MRTEDKNSFHALAKRVVDWKWIGMGNQDKREATADERLESVAGELLRAQELTLSVAESCTGGLLGHLLTNVPGSSDYFKGGVVAYSYAAKERVLNVRHGTLYDYGAVSEQTALELAQGVRRLLHTDVALSVTGIAGPGGGMPGTATAKGTNPSQLRRRWKY